MPIFGDNTQVASAAFGANAVIGRKFTLSGAASVTSMSIWNSTAGQSFQMAIYADSSGQPGALKGATNTGTTAGASAFQTLNFASALPLAAGDYWLCVQYGGAVTTGHSGDGASGTMKYVVSAYPTLPDPFGTPTNDTKQISIYATYTPPTSAYTNYITSTLGAVGYWRLGESSGTTAADFTGNQNGVYTNTAGITYSAIGVSNDGDTGIVLDGDTTKGYVSIADVAAQHVGDTFTMGAWVRPDYILDGNTGIFGTAAVNGPVLGLNADGTVYTGKDNVAFITTASSAKINDGLKHLVVWAKNGATNHLWFDRGVDVSNSPVNSTMANATGYRIGSNHGSATADFFCGFIDEVFLLPTAMSQAQVQALYDLAFVFTAPPTPSVSRGAANATLAAGSTNQAASGGTSYQWRRHGANIPGANSTSYPFSGSDYAKEVTVNAVATSAAAFTTEQASPARVTPTANGNTWTRPISPIVGGGNGAAGVKYWEPCVVLDTTNSQYVLFADPASGPTFNATGLGRWTCPFASDPLVTGNWTFSGTVIAGVEVSSPTVVDQSTQWRIYYYDASIVGTSPLLTRTSTDKGVTWSAATTAIAANAVAWATAWDGTFAWPTNGVLSSANWEMLVGGVIAGLGPPFEFALAYAKSTDSGATYTLQNGGFYTTPASTTAGCRGGGPCLLNGGQPINGKYWLIDHISSAVAHQAYPTDVILAYSTDLTNLAGWTLVGDQIDHNALSPYTGAQTADGWVFEHGGSTYMVYSGSRGGIGGVASADQGGSVHIASFPGTAAQFIAGALTSTFDPAIHGGFRRRR